MFRVAEVSIEVLCWLMAVVHVVECHHVAVTEKRSRNTLSDLNMY